MIEQADLDAAVAAQVLTGEQRAMLIEFVRTRRRAAVGPDEEQIRFITSFNDIFVTIAVGLLLFAVGALLGRVDPALGAVAVAASSWGLAEYFSRVRRMALPSIVLLLAFAGAVFVAAVAGLFELFPQLRPDADATVQTRGTLLVTGGLAAAVAMVAHWRRFGVPITIAAGAAAATALAVGGVALTTTGGETLLLATAAVCGLAAFALAMRFDAGDPQRVTRRTDIAFWLHLLAAPLLMHPLFTFIKLFEGPVGPDKAAVVIAVYLVLTVIALAIDRRALLVSALGYVIYAIQALFRQVGDVDTGFAVTFLVIGLFLVMLSAGWQRIRGVVIPLVPVGWSRHLPPAAVLA